MSSSICGHKLSPTLIRWWMEVLGGVLLHGGVVLLCVVVQEGCRDAACLGCWSISQCIVVVGCRHDIVSADVQSRTVNNGVCGSNATWVRKGIGMFMGGEVLLPGGAVLAHGAAQALVCCVLLGSVEQAGEVTHVTSTV